MKILLLWRGAITFRILCCSERATSSWSDPASLPTQTLPPPPETAFACFNTALARECFLNICRWIRLPQKSNSRMGASLPLPWPSVSHHLPTSRARVLERINALTLSKLHFCPIWHRWKAEVPYRCIHSLNKHLLNTSHWKIAIKTGNRAFTKSILLRYHLHIPKFIILSVQFHDFDKCICISTIKI